MNEAPEDAILVEAPVGDRNAWKGNASHPYRVRFNVPAIPTLVKWSKVEEKNCSHVKETCIVSHV